MATCNCDWYGTGEGSDKCPVHGKGKEKNDMKQKTKVATEKPEKTGRMMRPVTEETAEKPAVKTEENPSVKAAATATSDDFMDALASISAPKESTTNGKKDKMITLVPSDEVKIKVDEYVDAKKKEREYKTAKENRQETILDFATAKYEEDGLNGNFQKSYRIQGVKETVTFVTSDRFSSIKAEEIPALKELLGDKFNDFVVQKTVVSIKDDVMLNPTLRKELINFVPKEVFGKFFKADVYYSTADEFDRKIFSLPKNVYNKIRAMLKQASAALKS
jgi:hypothetical protein